jgi:hypothetical protein
MRFSIISSLVLAGILFFGCDKSNPVGEDDHEHGVFETIEHGCIHMADAGEVVTADSTLPGPHLDEEDFEHTRLNVALVKRDDGSNIGYIHFGPDITGDIIVMTSEDVPLAVTNRTSAGDTELEIEESFTAQQIADEAECDLLKKAIVFEAQEGGNIIKIGPTTFDTVSVIIEEGAHEHNH